MITFDDGYFNNRLALDVLRAFHVPATFFISTDPVLQGKAFWWEALGRKLTEAGVDGPARATEFRRLKSWTSDRVDSYLKKQFGDSVLSPRGDFDRPFTVDELRDFARSEWVHLGNHTCVHAILTHLSPSEIEREVRGCQDALSQIAGQAPIAIAYPNGNHSPAAVAVSLAAGLRGPLRSQQHAQDADQLRVRLSSLMALWLAFAWIHAVPRQRFAVSYNARIPRLIKRNSNAQRSDGHLSRHSPGTHRT